ncbi:MAG: helix-turn-helix transcriptional regulator [Deltaproteobacteria bacterium]|nr:helix-turn-helix transcriptional regulator [Deltaproteobacteria bacterium]
MVTKLQDKAYRDAFVGSQINIELAFQIRALREKRGWTQGQLAKKAGMAQPRISAIETPGKGKLNLETLRRLASAFDVGLTVRFVPFSEMIEWVEYFSPDSFSVPSFEEDMRTFLQVRVTPLHKTVLETGHRPERAKAQSIVPAITANTPTHAISIRTSQGRPDLYGFSWRGPFPTGSTGATAVSTVRP